MKGLGAPVNQKPFQPQQGNRFQPRPIALEEKIGQLVDLQEKMERLQAELEKIKDQYSQVLTLKNEAEGRIYAQLTDFNPKKNPHNLRRLQSWLIQSDKPEKIREMFARLAKIARKTNQPGLANDIEYYLKTAEGFRLIWCGLSPEERKERALVAWVSPENANAFYRAALAYQKSKLAAKFLEMIPLQWRAAIEGKTPTSVEKGTKEI